MFIYYNFVVYIFASCSNWNARPNIRKSHEFTKFKIMSEAMIETDEIKEWRTQSVKHKVAVVLILDGVSFSYDGENGIMFTAPDFYVEELKEQLMHAYGCSVRPIINEIK